MSVFRRRKRQAEPDGEPAREDGPAGEDGFVDDLDEQDRAYEDELLLAELAREEAEARRPVRPAGPWDADDAPEDEVTRVDLGGLRIPVPQDVEVRVDVSPEGEVVSATLVHQGSSMQVNGFAAPRSEGIWAAVAEEIAGALTDSGGTAELRDGVHGVELHATVPTQVPGGVALAPARFLGIDGPRWFLRALLLGRAAIDAAAAAPLESALKDVVVVRGGLPMAVRDALPLRLPPDVQRAPEDGPAGDGPALGVPERGEETTETR